MSLAQCPTPNYSTSIRFPFVLTGGTSLKHLYESLIGPIIESDNISMQVKLLSLINGPAIEQCCEENIVCFQYIVMRQGGEVCDITELD